LNIISNNDANDRQIYCFSFQRGEIYHHQKSGRQNAYREHLDRKCQGREPNRSRGIFAVELRREYSGWRQSSVAAQHLQDLLRRTGKDQGIGFIYQGEFVSGIAGADILDIPWRRNDFGGQLRVYRTHNRGKKMGWRHGIGTRGNREIFQQHIGSTGSFRRR